MPDTGANQSVLMHQSPALFAIAKAAARRAKEIPEGTRSAGYESITSVMMCCASIEAFCHEIGDEAMSAIRCPDGTPIPTAARQLCAMWPQIGRMGGVDLAFAVRCLMPGDNFDSGTLPAQDFELLVRLRNNIVHLKPYRGDQPLPKIESQLRSRGVWQEPRDLSGYTFWLDWLNTYRIAEWACDTLVATLAHFARGWDHRSAGFLGKLESKVRFNFRIYEDWRPKERKMIPPLRPDSF